MISKKNAEGQVHQWATSGQDILKFLDTLYVHVEIVHLLFPSLQIRPSRPLAN